MFKRKRSVFPRSSLTVSYVTYFMLSLYLGRFLFSPAFSSVENVKVRDRIRMWWWLEGNPVFPQNSKTCLMFLTFTHLCVVFPLVFSVGFASANFTATAICFFFLWIITTPFAMVIDDISTFDPSTDETRAIERILFITKNEGSVNDFLTIREASSNPRILQLAANILSDKLDITNEHVHMLVADIFDMDEELAIKLVLSNIEHFHVSDIKGFMNRLVNYKTDLAARLVHESQIAADSVYSYNAKFLVAKLNRIYQNTGEIWVQLFATMLSSPGNDHCFIGESRRAAQTAIMIAE